MRKTVPLLLSAAFLLATQVPTLAHPDHTEHIHVAAANGQAILNGLMGKIMKSPGLEATVLKTEQNLKTGANSRIKMKVYGKPPHTIKVEVLEHYKSSKNGVKLLYKGGDAKAQVQAGGALKFVKTTLAMNSDDLTTANNYMPDQVDLYGLAKRLSRSKITVQVLKGNILKITPQGTNLLDSRIQYELIGYNPANQTIRFWKAYANNKAYYNLDVLSMTYLSKAPNVFSI